MGNLHLVVSYIKTKKAFDPDNILNPGKIFD
jgi:FAD/FMN-containing dehydrogenase